MLPFHKEFSALDVKYYSLIEPWLFVNKATRTLLNISNEQEEMIANQKTIVALYKEFIKDNKDINIFLNASNIFNLNCLFKKNLNFVYRSLPEKNLHIEKLNKFNVFAGSFHAPLALAYFMGYEEINLVGFDAWTLQKSRSTRFYEIGEGEISILDELDDNIFGLINNERKIRVISPSKEYSVSRIKEGKTLFYEDLFSTKAIYRENFELVSTNNLKAISFDPILKVY